MLHSPMILKLDMTGMQIISDSSCKQTSRPLGLTDCGMTIATHISDTLDYPAPLIRGNILSKIKKANITYLLISPSINAE